jgi:hypothetical protein
MSRFDLLKIYQWVSTTEYTHTRKSRTHSDEQAITAELAISAGLYNPKESCLRS